MELLAKIANSPPLNGGMFCLILYMLLKIYYKNYAILNAQKIFEKNEYFICDITPVILFDYLFAFAYGYSLCQLFSVEIEPALPLIGKFVHYISVIWKYTFAFGGIFLFTIFASPRTFITNKRVMFESGHLLFTREDVKLYRYENIQVYFQEKMPIGRKFILSFKNIKKPLVIYSLTTRHYNAAVKIISDAIESMKEKMWKAETGEELAASYRCSIHR